MLTIKDVSKIIGIRYSTCKNVITKFRKQELSLK